MRLERSELLKKKRNSWQFRFFVVTLQAMNAKKKGSIMATYAVTLNERTANGKALMAYLQALGVLVRKISPKSKGSFLRSQEDKLAGRIETFGSSEEMFQSLGI